MHVLAVAWYRRIKMTQLILSILLLPFIGAWLYGILESYKLNKPDSVMFGRCILLALSVGSFILLLTSWLVDLLSSMIVNKWFEMLLKLNDISV